MTYTLIVLVKESQTASIDLASIPGFQTKALADAAGEAFMQAKWKSANAVFVAVPMVEVDPV
jgi:hypothetical protein